LTSEVLGVPLLVRAVRHLAVSWPREV